jgi:hypothetical protein
MQMKVAGGSGETVVFALERNDSRRSTRSIKGQEFNQTILVKKKKKKERKPN